MKKTAFLKSAVFALSLAAALILCAKGFFAVKNGTADFYFTEKKEFFLVSAAGGADKEKRISPVEFKTSDGRHTLVLSLSGGQIAALGTNARIEGDCYQTDSGGFVAVPSGAGADEVLKAERDFCFNENSSVFGAALAFALFSAGLFTLICFGKHFSGYEQLWFISILAAAAAVSVIAPEDEINGVSGLLLMALYLADTFLNILCELLISKQSKWNFIVSVFVELNEILMCVLLAYRFATLASTLFFWLPVDIASFISWNRHPDRRENELTVVRTLSGRQEALVLSGIAVWTVGVGFFLTTLDFGTELFGGSRSIEVLVCFLDAAASAVGIANGIFILLRMREQWIAWFVNSLLEAAINILSGQYVLLVLKAGYLTNSVYGYLKWTRYIHKKSNG